ncbi:hypothetical protein I5679_12170 [Citrobacter koseri]|jgi:hypothetical protein|uniref:hypothetical protein n=1 Tax=Citrobacter koseri TaxID=545 RepID=UPI001902AE39|nr:hypothetical protein [Citrobacter koseri]MBJ9817639.1 hypothetical protein [Citrobacter koseri]HEM6696355.1 hypothetical protein [Citrobacter koseri]
MGIFFEPYKEQSCCLCGSGEFLTGEHKIKASALRKIFGRNEMVIGHFDSQSIPRTAQGPKSNAFHFSARMCALCNNTRTQVADHEFDLFHSSVSSYLSKDTEPSLVFDLPRYKIGTEAYLNVFRYFAKILCCQVAESCGPRPLEVCEFAIGKTTRNVIILQAIDTDPMYQSYSNILGDSQFAAHGGLRVGFDFKKQIPTSFQSSISLGAVRYVFEVKFGDAVGIELRTFFYEFWCKCEAANRSLKD